MDAVDDPTAALLLNTKDGRSAENFGSGLLRAHEQIDVQRVLGSEVAPGSAIAATHAFVEVNVARTLRTLHRYRDCCWAKFAGRRDSAQCLEFLRYAVNMILDCVAKAVDACPEKIACLDRNAIPRSINSGENLAIRSETRSAWAFP